VVGEDEDAFDLFDHGALVADFGDGFEDGCLPCLIRGCDVDVEALRADDLTGVVVEAFADDNDFAGFALDRDMRWRRVLNGLWVWRMSSSVAAMCSSGCLWGKHLRGPRISGSTGRIAVDLLDLGDHSQCSSAK
jgi:hypothetical protein